MKWVIGSDHAGYALKQRLIEYLEHQGHEVEDLGPSDGDHPASYVPPAILAGQKIREGEAEQAVLICGTGLGISIAANKVEGLRAALCTNEYMARMAREHNDANVLCLGARIVAPEFAVQILASYIDGIFESGGRHEGRVNEIKALEHSDHIC